MLKEKKGSNIYEGNTLNWAIFDSIVKNIWAFVGKLVFIRGITTKSYKVFIRPQNKFREEDLLIMN